MQDFNWFDNEWINWAIEIPGKALIIVVLAIILRFFAHRIINRIEFRAASGTVPPILAQSRYGSLLTESNPGAAQRRQARAKALGSLLRSVTTAVVFSIAFVMVLDVVGLNIAPLLTGAGVVGVALGFGAQTLVKDFLSGIFLMVEDQYGVGDSIDLGDISGDVEAVGLRVTRLRDLNGTVWFVRNGEILRVGNNNQLWKRMVLDITVPVDSDFDRVYALLMEEATAVAEHQDFTESVIGGPEIWGIDSITSDGAVVRLTVKTLPHADVELSRVLRRRILQRFDHEGISTP